MSEVYDKAEYHFGGQWPDGLPEEQAYVHTGMFLGWLMQRGLVSGDVDDALVRDAAALTPQKLAKLSRPGFKVVLYDTLEDFYLAESLEYIAAWRQSTPDNPAGICGPIGPTEQLPLVARIVNALSLDVRSAHFRGMDEWVNATTGREVPVAHPLSFERCDRELCFDRIDRKLRMPDAHLHFPKADTTEYRESWNSGIRCALMQGGQGDVKHWAFNDPLPPSRARS